MRVLGAVVVAALATSACKKSPSYDLSSPEATLTSFFGALDKGRLPEDLPRFLADPTELSTWRMRCESRGCERGSLTILEVAERSDDEATVVANYQVFGERRARVMHGKQSPIRFRREGDVWRIVQFGRRIPVPTPPGSGADERDAVKPDGPATPPSAGEDGGSSDGAPAPAPDGDETEH